MKKRFSAIVCVVLMLFITISIPVYATELNTLSITLTNSTVHPGEEVSVNFDFGMALGSFTFTIGFDENLFEYVNSSGATTSIRGNSVVATLSEENNSRTVMSVTFRAKDNIATSNPTQFMITGMDLTSFGGTTTFNNITVPIIRDILVEPEYIDYLILIGYEGTLESNVENFMGVRIVSPMGRYHENLRLVAEVITPLNATLRLLGRDSDNVEHDVILSGWGGTDGFGLGGNVDVLYDFRGIFSEDGEYTLTLSLIDRDNSDVVVSTITQPLIVGEVATRTEIVPTGSETLPKTGVNIYIYLVGVIAVAIVAFALLNRRK